MADMGLDFAPPKMSDHRAWKTLKSLYEVGMTFHGCGCSGPGYRPRDSKALIKFLEKRLQQYEQHAIQLDNIPLLPPNQELSTEPKGRWRKPRWRLMEREEARKHWNQKITMLRAELKKYKQ